MADRIMRLPQAGAAKTISTIGLFKARIHDLDWATKATALGDPEPIGVGTVEELVALLAASTESVSLRAFVPWEGWTLLLTDGPLGTDVGLLPVAAARRKGITAIRAVAGDRSTQLTVHQPGEEYGPLATRRSLAAHYESGWEWHAQGEPFAFEDCDRYRATRIRDRFTPEMLQEYLRALGAPADIATIEVGGGVLVRHVPGRSSGPRRGQPKLPFFSRARWWNRPLPRWLRTSWLGRR